MTIDERVRLYLRDQVVDDEDPRFSDEDIAELLALNSQSAYGATALGWLLTAAELSDTLVSGSVGNTSENYGGPTERYKVAMAMHAYWKNLYDDETGANEASTGLWWELVPDYADGTEGIVPDLIEHKQWLRDNWVDA